MTSSTEDLLDLGVVGPADVIAAEAGVAALLGTNLDTDVLLIQAEAIVALEAAAKSLARPGLSALNVVTGPYGALFGRWLATAGAHVVSLTVPFDRTVSAAEVEHELARGQFDLVAVVHAEAATGGVNPLEEIAAVVRSNGALLVVDAVASVGAHPVNPEEWCADIVVIGGQKALAGPAGVSALSISNRAWELIEQNPAGPRESILSLLDLRDGWLRSDKSAVLGTPSSLETAGLLQALARIETEGLQSVIARHRAAAAATRVGVRELGLSPWIADDRSAARVVTTIAVPPGTSVPHFVAAARSAGSQILAPAPGSLAATTLRVNHTGRAANLDLVLAELAAIGAVLNRPTTSALQAAEATWSAA